MLDFELNDVTLNYGFKNILDGASLQVSSGEKVALVGNNGTGKTSIFKLITGNEKPTKGTVSKRKDATLGYLSQMPPKADENTTVREFLRDAFSDLIKLQKKLTELENKMGDSNISDNALQETMIVYGKALDEFTNLGGYEVESNIEKMAGNLGITELLDQKYNSLSGGQKTIVCLGRTLLTKPDILLLDEPTNHLDISTLSWLESFIKGYTGSVMLVSHDRYFLDRTINKVLALENGKIKEYPGNYTAFANARKAENEAQEQAYVTQQKKISKVEETIRKNRAWGAQSSEKAYRVAKQLERRIENMDKVERPKEEKDIGLSFNQGTRSGNDVLKIQNLSFAYNDGDIILLDANMDVEYKDRVCLLGKNGTGKSTVIKLILGLLDGYDGNIQIGSNVRIGYLPQNISFEDENRTILEEFTKHFNGTTTQVYSTLAKFHFYGEETQKRISSLSGGEKVRLKLAELVLNNVNFLILDEPTNHLDIRNREVLEDAINEFGGTVLFVSHDRYFINKIANRVVELENCELHDYLGNYDDYHNAKFPVEEPAKTGKVKVRKA